MMTSGPASAPADRPMSPDDPEAVSLDDGAYRETARGPVLELTEPFGVTLDLPRLAR